MMISMMEYTSTPSTTKCWTIEGKILNLKLNWFSGTKNLTIEIKQSWRDVEQFPPIKGQLHVMLTYVIASFHYFGSMSFYFRKLNLIYNNVQYIHMFNYRKYFRIQKGGGRKLLRKQHKCNYLFNQAINVQKKSFLKYCLRMSTVHRKLLMGQKIW